VVGVNKTEAIAAVIRATVAEPVVFTTGYACRIARGIADRPNHFYMTGSMGLASAIGVGLAAETGVPTVVVDGDGAVLMNPVGMIVAGAQADLPLVHIVLDDQQYASTGGQPSPGDRADFAALARGCGYRRVLEARTAADLYEAVTAALAAPPAPVFVHCLLDGPDEPVPPRVAGDLAEHAERFAAFVAAARAARLSRASAAG
jgi:sulfopyruvate decarboxylase subunit beta